MKVLLNAVLLALVTQDGAGAADALKKVLFFSKSSGFEHSVIRHVDGKPSHVENVLAEIGKANGYEFTFTKDGRIFTKEGLSPFDAVFFYTTGDLTKPGNDGQPPMPPDGRQVLLDFISSGKGFIGTHSATDTFHSKGERFENNHECNPYICMLGGEFVTHGSQQVATVRVASPGFPGMAVAGGKLTLMEEWYAMKNLSPDLHVLLVQETATMTGNAKGNPYDRPEYPAAWARMQEKGRVYYTSLGHKPGTWTNPVFQSMLIGGLGWTTGRVEADVTANLENVTPGFATVAQPSKAAPELAAEEMPAVPGNGRNLAKGKLATVSGSQGGAKPNPAEHAVDGKAETYWAAKTLEFPQWLRVDLGASAKVAGSRITWTSAKHHFKYRIEGSTDDKEWKTLFDGSANSRVKEVEDRLDGPEVRYVRVTLTGIAAEDPQRLRPGIAEWELSGEAADPSKKATVMDPEVTAKEKSLLDETTVPEGFRKTIFAAPPVINYPTFIASAPDGTVYVSCDKNGAGGRKPSQGRIVRLRDTDGDGRADEVKEFVPDIDTPRGLVWDRDRLYVMHPPHLSVFIDKDGDGTPEESKVLVKNLGWGFKDRSGDHASDGLDLGVDGWLYGSIGDFGFFNAEGVDGKKVTLRGGGVIRVRPDGTGLEIHSRGTRNVYAVAVDPLLNVFGRDNNNDGSWGVLLHHFTGMDHHGYPSLFMRFPEDRVAPLADYVTGSGSGALYLDEPGIPEKYLGLHTCDWGKSFVYHHPLKPVGATFTAGQEEFIGAPRTIDFKVDASSNLYVASWRGAIFNYSGEEVGYIARVSPGGYQAEPLPDFRKAAVAQLVELLASPSARRRLEAQRELIGRGISENDAKEILKLAADGKRPLEARVAAVFTLKQALGVKSHAMIAPLMGDAAMRSFAIRAITDRPEQMQEVPVKAIISALDDVRPRTRLEAARALARMGDGGNATVLAAHLGEKDPVVRHTLVKALETLEADAACFAVVDDQASSAVMHAAALRVLRGHHIPEVVSGVIERLKKESDVTRRGELFTALCRLHFREGEWKGTGWGLTPDITGPYFQTESWEKTSEIAAVLRSEIIAAKGDEAAFLIGELNRHQIHMDEAVASILRLAAEDEKHLPAAVDMVARGALVPETAVPLLVRAANNAKAADEVRGNAVVALARTSSRDGCLASLRVFVDFETKPRAERMRNRPFKRAKEAFFGSKSLVNQAEVLVGISSGKDDALASWAYASLLKISSASPTGKAALDQAWQTPAGKVRMLKGISLGMLRGEKERVISALTDPDKSVTAQARITAKELKLDPSAKPSPLIGTLSPEAVIRKMAKMKGDKELGEQLFNQQSCVTCHTVRPGEALKAGPYLGGTAGVYRRDELAEMILNPSKSFAQGYEPHQLTTGDGVAYIGFIESADKEKVVFRDMAMQRTEIPTADVSSNLEMEMSLMPPGLAANLTEKELAALLSYLESLSQH